MSLLDFSGFIYCNKFKMAEEANKKRKFKKSQYGGANKKKRLLESLGVGMSGVLVTCNEKEKNCVREVYNVLNEYADKLYGTKLSSQADEHNSSEEDNIEEAIAKEKQNMKTQVTRFQSVKSGAKNVIFVKTVLPNDESPDHLAHGILTDILENGYQKTRYCLRFLPIGASCYAGTEEIEKAAKQYLNHYFFSENAKPTKFCVVYKARNNNTIKRDDIIGTLARLVLDSEKDHSVDLKNPHLTICVEIIKNICCLAVVKDFHKLKRYNIQEVQIAANKKYSRPQDLQRTENKKYNEHVLNSAENISEEKIEVNRQEQEGNATTKVTEEQKTDVNIQLEKKEQLESIDKNGKVEVKLEVKVEEKEKDERLFEDKMEIKVEVHVESREEERI